MSKGSSRKSYHVTPSGNDGWKVKAEGAERASSRHDTKQEAVQRARELAKSQEQTQVIVHRQDGTFQTEWTYGNDPFPPPG